MSNSSTCHPAVRSTKKGKKWDSKTNERKVMVHHNGSAKRFMAIEDLYEAAHRQSANFHQITYDKIHRVFYRIVVFGPYLAWMSAFQSKKGAPVTSLECKNKYLKFTRDCHSLFSISGSLG